MRDKYADRGSSSGVVVFTCDVLEMRTLSSPLSASKTSSQVFVFPCGDPFRQNSFTTIIWSAPHIHGNSMSHGIAECGGEPLKIKGNQLQHDAHEIGKIAGPVSGYVVDFALEDAWLGNLDSNQD